MPFPRASGVLLHPTSLPGPHGIGSLGGAATRFIDRLAEASQTLWQMLPLGPTSASNSPYQALSSFAGNPLLVSLDHLVEENLLTPPDARPPKPFPEGCVDFDGVRRYKERALRKAFAAFLAGKASSALREELDTFRRDEAGWLDDFALYMALKEKFGGKAWTDWPEPKLVVHDADAVAEAADAMREEVDFHAFCQFLFFRQWTALKRYANGKGIRLMGDVPIYVACDSADVWASPQYFELDASGAVTQQAGVPPDFFAATGQLWGNPIYKWDRLQTDGYGWWIDRIRATLRMVDMLRIDHFRAFEAYWQVPAGEETAVNGKWIPGPGADFFKALQAALGENLPIVAEDLGTITAEVHKLRTDFRIPGMKVLQFAFHPGARMYLPHMYESNCVAYTATHDNDTTRGWYAAEGLDYDGHDRSSLDEERDRVRRYIARDGSDIAWDLIRLVLQSVADTAIVPMQDLLDLGNDARMNRPGQSEGQWSWRMTTGEAERFPVERLRELTWLYDRAPEQREE